MTGSIKKTGPGSREGSERGAKKKALSFWDKLFPFLLNFNDWGQ